MLVNLANLYKITLKHMYGIKVFFSRHLVQKHNNRYYADSTKKLLKFLEKMPKANSARIADAQRQRQQISKKSDKYGPSTVYLQVLGSGARGAPNTLYLFTDQKRYLFNCGECTQRLAHEHKVKLSRLEHIFITSKTWGNIGGLPGLSLTLQDVGVPNITLHGPDGLDELYHATRRFVIMKDMNVTMAKCTPSEDFDDSVMNVKYVLLGPHDSLLGKDLKPTVKKPRIDTSPVREFEEFIHDDTDYYTHNIRNNEERIKINSKEKPKLKINVDKDHAKRKTEKVLQDLQKKSNCSVSYICTLKKRLGTLDLAKCVEFGVKPGPLLGQLKNGQDVVLPDGTLVLSKDVKTPDDPGPVFIVLEVPDISYLKESEFSAHFDNGKNCPESIPSLIVHYTPPHVFHHPSYRSFMAQFGPSTRHLVLNAQNSCLGSEAVHRTQHKLHLLDPDIFPLLKDVSVPAVWNAHPPVPKTSSPVRLKGLEELKNKIALAQFQNIISMEGSCKGDGRPPTIEDADSTPQIELITGKTLTIFHLRPNKQLDRSAEPKLHIQEYIQETMDVDGFVSSLEQFRQLVDGMRYAKSGSLNEYPKVVFLGTGSCIPSKTRNTSAIVVQIDENRSILLDCGEGTFGQLVRFYGAKKVNAFLTTLKAIYISHLHADHHIGLFGVLQARRYAFEELSPTNSHTPCYLLAPGQIVTWLNMYDQQFERIKPDFTLIPNQNLLYDSTSPKADMTSAVLASIGLQKIETCLVAHCPNAFGVAFELDRGQKITYSGDTLPCEELVKIGNNSTLLIHEATMEDELAGEARIKMHSTTSQAIDIGRQMRARYTVLTHFSQRYARLPRLNANILNDNNTVGIAFDNMQITMNDLELLPHMYAPLQLMFAEHCVEMELKAAHRIRQKERLSSPTLTGIDSRHKHQGQVRKRSPSCRGVNSAPAPHAKYRESNASRLRQEIKGMTLSGTIGRVPRSKSSSPTKPSSRSHSESVTPGARREISPEKSAEYIPTTRSISENFNLRRDDEGRVKVTSNIVSGYVVDTRSKTLNSVARTAKADEVMNIMSKNGKDNSRPVIAPPTPDRNRNGYGPPLVTSMRKKLIIERELLSQQQTVSAENNDKQPSLRKSSLVRNKSAIHTLKAVNKETTSSTTKAKHEPMRSKLPATATRRSSVVNNNNVNENRNIHLISGSNGKHLSRATSLRFSTGGHKIKKKLPQEPSKKQSESTKKLSVRDINAKCRLSEFGNKHSTVHSNRSFKPQLEDIKSSYLLLNNIKDKSKRKTLKHGKSTVPPVTRPKPVDETVRKQQLLDVKRKFQSKQFWNETKYDNIEGLNWISWK